MAKKKEMYVPTVGEEVANAVSHGVMSFLALAALPFAAVWAYVHDPDGVLAAASVSVFVISIFLMFLASTLYHSMNPQSKHKDVFHILDHIFIYVAIAGSYTPIALVLRQKGIPLSPHGLASADKPRGRGALRRDRLLPLLIWPLSICTSIPNTAATGNFPSPNSSASASGRS
mgnify:CR=1 FL=1